MNNFLLSIPNPLVSGGGSGTGVTNNANSLTTGTLPDARLSGNVTVQGNSFNGVNQLLKLNGSGQLPALDGSLLTGISGGGGSLTAATQSEAIAGTENTHYMTALRVQQALTSAFSGYLTTSGNDSRYVQLSTYTTNRTTDQNATATAQTTANTALTNSSSNSTALVSKPNTIQAATYANAQTLVAALPAGTSAIVRVAADESTGNAGTGTSGANPVTYYLYFSGIGLIQLVTY